MEPTQIGREARAARIRKGWFQDEAAERLGMTVERLSSIEMGRVTDPKRSEILALQEKLGIDPSVWGITAGGGA